MENNKIWAVEIVKKLMKKILLVLGVLSIIGFLWWILYKKEIPVLNPLINKVKNETDKVEIKTVGFLPTWMVGKTRLYGKELDELIFLGVEVDTDGNLIWNSRSKKIDNEDFLKQKENITKTGGENILGIKLFIDEDLDKLLENNKAVDNLVGQIKETVEGKKFDGVNVDFEYQNNPTAILNQNFFDFLEKLKLADVGKISVDVFVNTINKGSIDQIKDLMDEIDELIIMAYDFHRPGVDYTGAVAPIDAPMGERSILELVKNITNDRLDKNKIILAYPLYGYEWKTYTQDFGSQIKRGWYQMVSYKRSQELIKTADANALAVKWDDLSMTPWLVFEEENQTHQIYYENEKSLEIKIKLAEDNQFLGVGFWALGYEGMENLF